MGITRSSTQLSGGDTMTQTYNKEKFLEAAQATEAQRLVKQ